MTRRSNAVTVDSGKPPAPSGRARQKLRTKRQLLSAAVTMVAAGRMPTVTQVADAAGISRRTAYRYFPSQAKLLAEAALEGVRPRMQAALERSSQVEGGDDVAGRLDRAVEAMMREAFASEMLLRTMVHATVLEGTPPETPRRGLRRVDWIEVATEGLRARIGRVAYGRLVSALALCVGVEALLVFQDIRGLSATEAIATSRWMAQAVLRQCMEDARGSAAAHSARPARERR